MSIERQELFKQEQLSALCSEDEGEAFPYSDVRRVRADFGLHPHDLIPELDLYFSDIAGAATYMAPVFECSQTRLEKIGRDMARDFFEIRPEYECVRAAVDSPSYPTFRRVYQRYEAMRMLLLEMAETQSHRT